MWQVYKVRFQDMQMIAELPIFEQNNMHFSINTRVGKTTIWTKATKNIPAHSEILLVMGANIGKKRRETLNDKCESKR